VRLTAIAVVLSAAVVASDSAVAAQPRRCPNAPALGTITFVRGQQRHAVSFGTCADRTLGRAAPVQPPPVRSRQGRVATVSVTAPVNGIGAQTILVDGRPVYRQREDYRHTPGGSPGLLIPLEWSPNGKWLFFSLDPDSSASLAADGLVLSALRIADGHVVPITTVLLDDDYRTWCGSTLVLTAGHDRIATTSKRLVVATAPGWKPRPLWADPKRAFGSVACSPDGSRIAVLSQPVSRDADFFSTRWQLWQVGLDGTRRLLDAPPAGSADESPLWSPRGDALLFVREHRGHGSAMLLRNGILSGPVAQLGYSLGFYGHHAWWVGATWHE
jgi:WD40-like Beta Propeller Repeat